MSPFGGYTFSGSFVYDEDSYAVRFAFDESSDISGYIKFGSDYNGQWVLFTGTFADNVLTMQMPATNNVWYPSSKSYSTESWAANKTVKATLSGDTFTVDSCNFGLNLYKITVGTKLTCKGFTYVEPTPHTHNFNIQNAIAKYLVSEATCQHGATYYYSCECGEAGTETFIYGEAVDHVYVNGQCKWCGSEEPKENFNVTFVLGNGENDIIVSVADGSTVGAQMPANPTRDGYTFLGWFVGDVEFTSESVIGGATVVTAKWEENKAPAIVGTWTGFNLYSANTSSDRTISALTNVTVINADGTLGATYRIDEGSTVDLSLYGSVVDGALMIGEKYAYLNAAAGILWYSYNSNSSSVGDDTCLMFNDTVESVVYSGSKFSPYAAWMTVTYKDGSIMNVFLYKNKVYDNVTWNEGVTASAALNASSLVINDKNGNAITAYVNKQFVALDGLQGTYTGNDSDLVLDGVGGFVWGDKSGSYVYDSATSDTIDLYVKENGESVEYYYVILVDGEYDAEKTMVEVTLDSDYGEFTNIGSTNKNIAIVLPTDLTDDTHVFKGWYNLLDDSKTILPNTYIPTEDVILVAKWEIKVTLTVVYGNGLETVVLNYASGDVATPQEPAMTDGKVFDHWYLSDDDGVTEKEVYTPSTITEVTVIYCAWREASPLYGNYIGFETWGTGNGYLTAGKTASINSDGKATSGNNINYNTADYDATTGFLNFGNYYGYYDSVNGILVYNYNSGTGNQNDVYIMFKDASKLTASKFNQISWNSGYNKLIDVTVEYADGTAKNMLIYFADKKVQVVSVTTEPEDTSVASMYNGSTYTISVLSVFDTDGTKIAMFELSADKKDLLYLDDSKGEYTWDGHDNLVLSGTGSATIGSNSDTVTKAAEGSSYSYDLYMNENDTTVYYELTID